MSQCSKVSRHAPKKCSNVKCVRTLGQIFGDLYLIRSDGRPDGTSKRREEEFTGYLHSSVGIIALID